MLACACSLRQLSAAVAAVAVDIASRLFVGEERESSLINTRHEHRSPLNLRTRTLRAKNGRLGITGS